MFFTTLLVNDLTVLHSRAMFTTAQTRSDLFQHAAVHEELHMTDTTMRSEEKREQSRARTCPGAQQADVPLFLALANV